MKRALWTSLVLVQLGVSSVAVAGESVVQLRSEEDPSVTPDLSVCAAAPFRFNVRLTASLWATATRSADGKVVNDAAKKVGEAHACLQLTNFTFPAGLVQNFYARFDLPEGSFTALGTCTLTSNDVPKKGLVLAGCSLKITGSPAGYLGGIATSSSVFNPFKLPGFNTGSYWTLHLYDDGTPGNGLGRGLDLVEDTRSDADIATR